MKIKTLWAVSLSSVVITCAAIPFMDDQVPMHYNISGEVDRWGSKHENFIFPAIILAFSLFWTLLIAFYRKKALSSSEEKDSVQAASNLKVLNITAIATTVLFVLMQCFFLATCLSSVKQLSGTAIIPLVLTIAGVFLIVCGNLMPKTRRNSIVGFRTPWSMKSDALWSKSNRFGGISLIVTGLLTILLSALLPYKTALPVFLILLLVDCVVSIVYSYIIWKHSSKNM